MRIFRNSLVAFGIVASALVVRAEQAWPQFRGPGSAGIGEGTNLPDTWSTTQNVKWKTAIPGQGERPAPTIEHRFVLYAIDFATGTIAWQRDVHRGVPPQARHLKNTQGGTYNVSPIVYGDYFYTLFDRGFFTCHDAKTGKEIYTKVRLDPTASGFSASPWAYNGKLFALSEDGTTYVIQAGPEFKVTGQNVLDEFTMASPAIHRNSLLIRTATSLYNIANP